MTLEHECFLLSNSFVFVKANATLTTNDIVISKLTQILSYLRHGGKRDAKKLKKKLASDVVASAADGGGKKPIEASLG